MNEKLNRKELKSPDKFVEFGYKFLQFVTLHRRGIIIVLISFVVALIFTSIYLDWAKKVEEKASFELYKIQEMIRKTEGKLTDEIEAKFKDLIKTYRRTYSALSAKLELADLYYNEKKYDKSAELFLRANKRTSSPLVKAISLTSLAYIKEIESDYQGSIKYFEDVLKYGIEIYDLQAYFGISRCYQKLGNTQQARATYNTIVSKYPNSEHAKTARQYLTYLDE